MFVVVCLFDLCLFVLFRACSVVCLVCLLFSVCVIIFVGLSWVCWLVVWMYRVMGSVRSCCIYMLLCC